MACSLAGFDVAVSETGLQVAWRMARAVAYLPLAAEEAKNIKRNMPYSIFTGMAALTMACNLHRALDRV